MSNQDLLPQVTEKSLALADTQKIYTFLVPLKLNKIEIAKVIKKRFDVDAKSVNTSLKKGKAQKTLVQRGRRRIPGRRSDVKKAYVTLAKGQKIALFEEKSK